MITILDRIIEQTTDDLKRRKREISLKELESFPHFESAGRDFVGNLKNDTVSVIAEIKKASPSKGVIRPDFNPLTIAESYINGGASAISVLTDTPFFQGDLKYLNQISSTFDIPLLRKDFIVDPYQVIETKAYGGDALLLIVSVLSDNQLKELLHAVDESGLDALVECYSEEDVDRLDWESLSVVGVNNRDLRNFKVDLHRGVKMLQNIPAPIIRVSESGLTSAADLLYLKNNSIDSALVGEYFMKEPDPGQALRSVLNELETMVESQGSSL